MARSPNSSRQTRSVLIALLDAPQKWWHGYDLGKAVGLKSGTLYPLLIRLHEQGLLEAEWRAAEVRGRPPRHLYRLTTAGASLARQAARDGEADASANSSLRPA